MSARRISLIVLVAVIVVAVLVWSPGRSSIPSRAIAPAPAATAAPANLPSVSKPRPNPTPVPTPEPIEVADTIKLNAPTGNIAGDLEILNTVFTNWRLDFPHIGNPWGENNEITAALTGANPLGLPLISRRHPAINAAGQLCDRWGTPFLFHALTGDRMEIRSAGPDKKFETDDDAVLTPP